MSALKCIWMECGYVEYKLCDRNYDCENCPFDKAIKKERDIKKSNESEKKVSSTFDKVITPNHIWISKQENIYALGLDEFAQTFFDRNCSISFPIVGSKLFEGKTFLWIIGSFGAIGFRSPIEGEVIWVNEELKNNSLKFFEGNSFDIDLVRVESSEKYDFKNFFTMEGKKRLIEMDKNLINEYLLKRFSFTKDYLTLPDGGELIKVYLNQLSNQEYLQLLKLLFNKKI